MKKFVAIILLISIVICTGCKPAQRITDEEDLILEAEDFFFTDKRKKFTIWLGMNQEECLSIVGQKNLEYINKEYEDCVDYYYRDYVMGFLDKKFVGIIPSDKIPTFKNWEIYKGINGRTKKNEIIRLLGEPTEQRSPTTQYFGALEYYFCKTNDGKYIKVKDINKSENLFVNIAVTFYYESEDSGVEFSLYYYGDDPTDENASWRAKTGI